MLDIGTGTGVLPRNMYRYGAKRTGTDISEKQIEQAKALSEGMDIDYYALSAENINFSDKSYDVITACQCFWYFNHEQTVSNFYRMLKPDERILILYMAWLPVEDKVAGASEKLHKADCSASNTGEPLHIASVYLDSINKHLFGLF